MQDGNVRSGIRYDDEGALQNDVTTAEVSFGFDNSYARLPERFFARVKPTRMPEPRLVRQNGALARELGLDPDTLRSPRGIEILAGNRLPADAEPLAMAYAGHQFGYFVPQLGDGRAILLGEVIDRERRPARHPAQGLRAHAILPHGRRPRRARAGAARVRRQRGDGSARRPDDTGAGRGHDRRGR